MKTGIRFVSMFMAVVLLLGMFPLQSFAAGYTCKNYVSCTEDGGEIYEIVKDNCPIRLAPNDKGEVVARGIKGQFISVKRVFRTRKLTQWAELNVKDGEDALYLYIENCKPHEHDMAELYKTANGRIEFCPACGYVQAYAEGKTSCDMTCVADQAFKGVYSEYDPSFSGVVAQILVGEIPYVGTAADLRDLIGDVQRGAPAIDIALDMLGIIPLVGAMKYSKHLDKIKYADDVGDMAKGAKKIMWGVWDDYDKIVENGHEYAKIGHYKYTKHAVDEFMNPSYMMNFDDHSRGILPSYVDWMLTHGKKDGTTVLVSEWMDESGAQMRKYLNGTLQVIEKNGDTVITCIPMEADDAAEMLKGAIGNK